MWFSSNVSNFEKCKKSILKIRNNSSNAIIFHYRVQKNIILLYLKNNNNKP